jgi:TRAP-type C4-dicarboxylate transport system permease small subunit
MTSRHSAEPSRDGTSWGGFAALVHRADTICRGLSQGMIIASGWGILLLGVLVSIDVVMRKVSGRNLGGVDEIAGYLFAIGISWSLAAGFYARSHIRIDILYQRFALIPRALLDLVAIVSLLFVALFLVYSSWLVLETSWQRSSHSASSLQVPLFIPQAAWLCGMVAFALSLAIATLKAGLAFAGGQRLAIVRDYGVMTPDEEAEEAVQQSLGRT